ncbi:MAG: AAA family ATPase [Alphaproteobacteria bacterium]|nr:AAA family ATPase [Alphaproteobacteria bacterium]
MTQESDYDPQRVIEARDRFFLISGCSGSGKSSLLNELARRGYRTVEEPGRQIVKEQLSIGGDALPWSNVEGFIDQVIVRVMHQMIMAARSDTIAFFDRGIVDAVSALERVQLAIPPCYSRALEVYRYNRKVFLSPPWPEIYRTDSERRHSFEDAAKEYAALEEAYPRYGYEIVVLPKLDVAARVDFVMSAIGA